MTYRIPTLNGMRAFEAAARHLSFKNAASELGVTPGAVSQQVRKLEETLGLSLFRRLTNGLLLTREGEAFHPKIAAAFDALTEAAEAIAPDLNARKFSLGLSDEVKAVLPAKWPRHSSALKHYVREILVTGDLELILNNELDGMVRTGNGRFGGLSSVRIVEDVHYVCRNGLMKCRQSEAIIEDLRACLGDGTVSNVRPAAAR